MTSSRPRRIYELLALHVVVARHPTRLRAVTASRPRYPAPVVLGILVYVDHERLAGLQSNPGPQSNPGERWTIRRGDLLARDLLRQTGWSLYVTTIREERVRLIAYLEDVAVDRDELGDATTCDLDLMPMLERLGCHGVDRFPTWAMQPRVLTRSDADLLRYHLGLPLDLNVPPPALPPPPPPPPPPLTGFEHDATAMRLLAAVYEDLASDTNRMVLADRLLELGDPRGEMIALQLARARSRRPASPRERELITQYGHTWVKLPGLALYGFRRGFLATAVVDDRATQDRGWHEHPAWATVEELETRNPALLLAPGLRSLGRGAIPGELLESLASHDRPLGLHTIVGISVNSGGRLVQGGVALPLHELQPLVGTRMLDGLRSMSISIETAPLAEQADRFLRTRLGMHLEHVELFMRDLAAVEPEPWRLVYERNRPLSLGLRGVVDGWLVVVVRQRGSIVVQLGAPATAQQPSIAPIVPAIASLGYGLGSIKVERVGADRFGIDLQPVVEELWRAFPIVELVSTHRWRSP